MRDVPIVECFDKEVHSKQNALILIFPTCKEHFASSGCDIGTLMETVQPYIARIYFVECIVKRTTKHDLINNEGLV